MNAINEIQTWGEEQLQAALTYNQIGLAIFPTEPGHKKPRAGDRWRLYGVVPQTADEVRDMFSTPSNIAVIGGAPSGNLVVLDFDDKSAFRQVCRDIKHLLTHSFATRTPSGGVHVYVRTDEEIRTSKLKYCGRAIGDVKAAGSYVIAPRSIFRDEDVEQPYTMHEDAPLEILELDTISLDALLTTAGLTIHEHKHAEPIPLAQTITYATPWGLPRRLIDEALIHPAPIGYRSEKDAALILRLVASGWTLQHVLTLYQNYARPGSKYRTHTDPRGYITRTYNSAVEYYRTNMPEIDRQAHEAMQAIMSWKSDSAIAIMMVFLRRVLTCGSATINLSVRDAADYAGITKITAQNHIYKLIDRQILTPLAHSNSLKAKTGSLTDGHNTTDVNVMLARAYTINFDILFSHKDAINTKTVKIWVKNGTNSQTSDLNTNIFKICSKNGTTDYASMANHDLFRVRGLGKKAIMIYHELKDGEKTVADIIANTGLARRTVYNKIKRGEKAGLWTQTTEGKIRLTGSLEEAAKRLGVYGKGKKQFEQHQRERIAFRDRQKG